MFNRSILTMLVSLATVAPLLGTESPQAKYQPPNLPPQDLAVVVYDRHSGVEVIEVDGLRFAGSFWTSRKSALDVPVSLAPGIHRLVVQWGYFNISSSRTSLSTEQVHTEASPLIVDLKKGRRYTLVASYPLNGKDFLFDGSATTRATRETAFQAMGVQSQERYPWLNNVFYDIYDTTGMPDLCWEAYGCWESYSVNGRDRLFAKNYVEKTTSKLNQAVRSEPQSPVGYLRRAMAQGWMTAPDYGSALADFNKAIEVGPRFAWAHYERGAFLYRRGDYDGALKDLSKAIELDPEFSSPFLARGHVWAAKGDPNKSIADYQRAIEVNSASVGAYHNRGKQWFEKGEHDKALADQSRAVEISPKFAPGYIARGVIWFKKGEYDKAIADYTAALAIDVESFLAYLGRGDARLAKNDFDKALGDYDFVIQHFGANSRVYASRGTAYWKKGNSNQAIADLTKAIELDPKSAQAYNGRGNAWYGLGDYVRAIADYTESLRLHEDSTVRANLAGAYQKAQLARGPMMPAAVVAASPPNPRGTATSGTTPAATPAPNGRSIIVRGTLHYYPDRSPVARKRVALGTASRSSPEKLILATNGLCPDFGMACGETDEHGFIQLEIDPFMLLKSLRAGDGIGETGLTVVVFIEDKTPYSVMKMVNGRFVKALWDPPSGPGVLDLDQGGELFLDYKK